MQIKDPQKKCVPVIRWSISAISRHVRPCVFNIYRNSDNRDIQDPSDAINTYTHNEFADCIVLLIL
jgi:hypothetical protein